MLVPSCLGVETPGLTTQLALFPEIVPTIEDRQIARSGSFVDNMSLPVHRWFRYSAGFAAPWVAQVLSDWGIRSDQTVLDPFAGSGTVNVVADTLGIASVGVEAHPVVARICKAKLSWTADARRLAALSDQVVERARRWPTALGTWPPLILKSYRPEFLVQLFALSQAWREINDNTAESELVWLALTGILRDAASVGTAQWQYILPNKTKKYVAEPIPAFRERSSLMRADIGWMKAQADQSRATMIVGDARKVSSTVDQPIDAVITSPPYANNYDYADALRLEMTFWGDVDGWGDLHDAVRKLLIVSSSQHASRERLAVSELLGSPFVSPIVNELAPVMERLARVRLDHGGLKHYHTMIGAYCRDIGEVLCQLRAVCKPGARMCWVIGDSAPYGVYCPIDEWIGTLALAAGFRTYRFEKLRDRNIKWKNRKHRVPLKEGLLWIEG